MIRFQAPQLPPARDVLAYFERSEESRWFSNHGPCHALLVERLEDYVGRGVRCVPVASATAGLMIALRALTGPAPGAHRVLMPSFTFAAPVNAVLWAGLEPVFVDVEADAFHLDPDALEAALRAHAGQVALVLAASTFGTPPSLAQRRRWEQAALGAGVPLLVDSAAGFGAVDEAGSPLGHQGNAEVFSFHATKPFAIGEGGVVSTEDRALAEELGRLANFGFEGGVVTGAVGINAKLAEWPAATALAVLDGFEAVLAARRARARGILAALAAHGYRGQAGTEGAAFQFVSVLAPTPAIRRAALERAERVGIELRSYFSVPLHRMPAFGSVPVHGELRCTEDLAKRVVSLPMANDLSEEQAEAIIDVLAAAARTPAGRRAA